MSELEGQLRECHGCSERYLIKLCQRAADRIAELEKDAAPATSSDVAIDRKVGEEILRLCNSLPKGDFRYTVESMTAINLFTAALAKGDNK